MRAIEVRLRKCLCAEPVLVGHHHELITHVAQAQHGGDHARDEAQLVEAVDLEIGGFLDQRAVAVDKKDRAHTAAPARTDSDAMMPSSRVFCSGVPTVMRSASSRPGVARRSRTTMPASSRASNAACGSVQRTWTKLACEGITRRQIGRAH